MVKKVKEDTSDSKLFAFIATFLSIIGFIIAILVKKDDKYVKFYAKQSLVLFIASIIVGFAGMILMFLPILGWLIYFVLNIIIFVLWLISWIYALSGQEKYVPIVGKYANKFSF